MLQVEKSSRNVGICGKTTVGTYMWSLLYLVICPVTNGTAVCCYFYKSFEQESKNPLHSVYVIFFPVKLFSFYVLVCYKWLDKCRNNYLNFNKAIIILYCFSCLSIQFNKIYLYIYLPQFCFLYYFSFGKYACMN